MLTGGNTAGIALIHSFSTDINNIDGYYNEGLADFDVSVY